VSDYTKERWDYLKALAPRSGTVVAHKRNQKRVQRLATGWSRRQYLKAVKSLRAAMKAGVEFSR
jgi:hypothetical protein